MFIDTCRAVGIAARFVSGYRRYGRDPAKRYMHAWPEVFLPGGGWRGYDPTQSTPVSDLHVAVAASHQPLACLCRRQARIERGSIARPLDGWVRFYDALFALARNQSIARNPGAAKWSLGVALAQV